MNKIHGAILVLALMLFQACSAPAEETNQMESTGPQTVKIGVSGPLVGDIAWLGTGMLNAAKLAASQESTENYTFEVVAEDDQCDPKQTVNAYNKLRNDGVSLFVGPACSSALLSVASLSTRDKAVLVTPGATNPDITTAGDYVFRTVPSDSVAGVEAAKFVFNDQGVKQVAVLYKNDAWGQGLSSVFSETYKGLGGEILDTESHEANATDLKTQLTRIKNSGATLLYAPTFPSEFTVMIKQMEELGMSGVTVVGGDAISDESTAQALKDSKISIMLTYPEKNEDNNATAFNSLYQSTYSGEAPAFSSDAFDAAKLLMQAVKAVGSNTDDVRDYLYSVEGYQGASGTITFDSNGDSAAKKIAVFKYDNGTIVPYVK